MSTLNGNENNKQGFNDDIFAGINFLIPKNTVFSPISR